jgi:nucleotide-binding universal stress UspA family protein
MGAFLALVVLGGYLAALLLFVPAFLLWVARGAALVVVGTRHRSAVCKFLLGSTAQRLVLEAACPVLVVKAEPV